MRKSKKIRQLEKANEQLNRTIKNMKVEELELQKHARYRLEDYCEGCPCVKPKAKIIHLRDDRGNMIFWDVYITCEYASRCAWLHGQLKKGNEQ